MTGHWYLSAICKSYACGARHLLKYLGPGDLFAEPRTLAQSVSSAISLSCPQCAGVHSYAAGDLHVYRNTDPPPPGFADRTLPPGRLSK